MKATSQPKGHTTGLTEFLRDLAFWLAVSLGVIALSGLYGWLELTPHALPPRELAVPADLTTKVMTVCYYAFA